MCRVLHVSTHCFVCKGDMGSQVDWYMCAEAVCRIPWRGQDKRFDRCTGCTAQLPLERMMEISSLKTHPAMIWVGEGWLIIRGDRNQIVSEYRESRARPG